MLVRHIKPILLVTGLITLSAAVALLAPGLFKTVNTICVVLFAGYLWQARRMGASQAVLR